MVESDKENNIFTAMDIQRITNETLLTRSKGSFDV